jgi:hypothetical protein
VILGSQAAKLGIRPGQRVHLHHPPAGWALADPPPGLAEAGADGPADLIIGFFAARAEVAAELDPLARRIFPAGALWVAWPRRAGGHRSDITDNLIRELALPLGLVDVKVAALDDDWSGLRLVWRAANRGSRGLSRRQAPGSAVAWLVWVFIDAESLRLPPWRSRSRSRWPTSSSTAPGAPRSRSSGMTWV